MYFYHVYNVVELTSSSGSLSNTLINLSSLKFNRWLPSFFPFKVLFEATELELIIDKLIGDLDHEMMIW